MRNEEGRTERRCFAKETDIMTASSEPIGEASVRGIFTELCFVKRRQTL